MTVIKMPKQSNGTVQNLRVLTMLPRSSKIRGYKGVITYSQKRGQKKMKYGYARVSEYCEQIEPPVRMIEPASAINRATQCARESH